MSSPITFAFFGTGALAESVLATLVRNEYIPALLVTKPDAPSGRHLEMKSPHIKTWADMKGIPTFQPESLRDITNNSPLHTTSYDVFIVASYGKFLPDALLELARYGVLNVHPSLLPEYRGPSPIESVLLDGTMTTGVSIMKLDHEMDHGPILVQSAFMINAEATSGTLEVSCGQLGGEILVQVLAPYIEGSLIPKEQDHSKATVCKKIDKSMGEITLTDLATDIRRKFRAFTPWPGLYFFHPHHEKQIRIKVTDIDLVSYQEPNATVENIILAVTPEGKKEMGWKSFVQGYMNTK